MKTQQSNFQKSVQYMKAMSWYLHCFYLVFYYIYNLGYYYLWIHITNFLLNKHYDCNRTRNLHKEINETPYNVIRNENRFLK